MSLRGLPAVDQLLQASAGLVSVYGRPLTLAALRTVLEQTRGQILAGGQSLSQLQILAKAELYCIEWTQPSLKPVINATGVILHTNLGRAPL